MRHWLIFFLLLNKIAFSQFNDTKWMYAYGGVIDFEDSAIYDVSYKQQAYCIFLCSNIVEPSTNNFFFFDGKQVGDTGAYTILNGAEMVDSLVDKLGGDLTWPQSFVIIPISPGIYYLCYSSYSDVSFHNPNSPYLDRFYYAEIDMLNGNQRGEVLSKKRPLLTNVPLSTSRTTICRHGNGKDWWLIRAGLYNRYYTFHVTNQGISAPMDQVIGDSCDFDLWGQCAFSRNGASFATVTLVSKLNIFDFDRCSGEFSNPKAFIIPDDSFFVRSAGQKWRDGQGGLGLAFSPSGRFIYVSSKFFIWQFDRQDSTWQKVGVYQYYNPPFDNYESFFEEMYLTPPPHNKILVSNYNGIVAPFHIIHNPDEKGSACNFEAYGFPIPYNANGLPNMPNYRLGPLTGSACDTVTNINSLSANINLTLFPNPANSRVTVQINNYLTEGTITITNIWGQVYLQLPLNTTNQTYDIANLPNGMYVMQLSASDKIFTGKFIKND